jgi:hypothetical protein
MEDTMTTLGEAAPAGLRPYAFDLFVIHAAADAGFVRGYLFPALNLSESRVLLMDDLQLGALVVTEIERGVTRSRLTVVVLSYSCVHDLAIPAATVDAFVARHPPAERVLVFVDQLEEIFTLTSAEERQRFIAMVHGLRAEPRCYFLFALRADFYGALMDSALWPVLSSISRIDLSHLRGEALRHAITRPAMGKGVYLDVRLCDRLVTDAADEPGVLPLVQETLRLLWDRRCHRYLGLAEYEALGHGGRGLDMAIRMRAGTAMSMLTDAQQMVARRGLLRIVSFGEGRADTRRQQERQSLRSTADNESEFSQCCSASSRIVSSRSTVTRRITLSWWTFHTRH